MRSVYVRIVSLRIRNKSSTASRSIRIQPACGTLRHMCVCCAPGHWVAACTSASPTSHGSLLGTAPAHPAAQCLFARSPHTHRPRRARQVRRRGLYGVRRAAQRRHLRSMEPVQRVHAVRGLSIPCVTITARRWHYFIQLRNASRGLYGPHPPGPRETPERCHAVPAQVWTPHPPPPTAGSRALVHVHVVSLPHRHRHQHLGRLHASCCHLVAVTEVEVGEGGEAAESAHSLMK